MCCGPPAGSRSANSAAKRQDSSKYSACEYVWSPKRTAGRSPNSVALRRSSAAALGATSGACPGAGTERERKPDIGVSLRVGVAQPPEQRDRCDLLVGEVGPLDRDRVAARPCVP